MPAVAMTDHGNLFGAVEFYNEANSKGVHPVIGCEMYVSQQGHKTRSDYDRYNHLVLLCETQEGYKNLINLVSTGYLDGFYYKPRIDKDLLARHSKGLIAMSACLRGDINETLLADRYDEARRLANEYTDLFGQEQFLPGDAGSRARSGQDRDAAGPAALAGHRNSAGGDQRLALPPHDDVRAHEILLCIQTGKTMSDPNRMRFATPDFFVKIARRNDEAVRRSGACAGPHVGHRSALPREAREGEGSVSALRRAGGHTADTYFACVAREGFEKRRPRLEALREQGRLKHDLAEYMERLEREIQMIQQMQFSGYFLIVWDFIRFAKAKRHSGGAGTRIRGRKPGRLCDGDHRYRPIAVRPAVRALPESGTHQHAGYRHRFLHEPARRSDPVRHREVRPRASSPNHHLRHTGAPKPPSKM